MRKADKLVEATMLALQGKLELKENRIKSKRAKKIEGIDVNVDDTTTVSVEGNETIVDTEDATVVVSKKEDEFIPETSTDLPMEAPVEEPVVDAPVAPDEDIVEVPADDTVMPEEVIDEPVDTELPEDEEEKEPSIDEMIGESKKVEKINKSNSDINNAIANPQLKANREKIRQAGYETDKKSVTNPRNGRTFQTKYAPNKDKIDWKNRLEKNKTDYEAIVGPESDKIPNSRKINQRFNTATYSKADADAYGVKYGPKADVEEGKQADQNEKDIRNKKSRCINCENKQRSAKVEAMKARMAKKAKKQEALNTLQAMIARNRKIMENRKLQERKYSDSTWYEYKVDDTTFNFLCRSWETSQNWGHEVELKAGYNTIGTARCTYYNRTWESFEYQTCMFKAITDAEKNGYDKDKLAKLKEQVEAGRGLTESKKVEDTEEYLQPRYDTRNSFYKKAKVITKDNGDEELYSYGTHVGGMRGGRPYSKGRFSQTTSRHQKEFFKQRGVDPKKVDVEEGKSCKNCDKEVCECDTKLEARKAKSRASRSAKVQEMKSRRVKKAEAKTDLNINEGTPKTEEPVPNTEEAKLKVENRFSSKTFNEALTKYYKDKIVAVESVKVNKISKTRSGLKIEAKILNKQGKVKQTICLEARQIQTGKSFDKYELNETKGLVRENKANNNKVTMTTFRNKYNIIECRYILSK